MEQYAETENQMDRQAQVPEGGPMANEPDGKSFTQDEVNEIVRKRLTRERENRGQETGGTGRLARELELREQDVRKREWKMEAKERLVRQNLPVEAAELLRYETEETFEESLNAMRELLGPKMQQAVERIFTESGAVPPKSPKGDAAVPDLLKEAFLRQK